MFGYLIHSVFELFCTFLDFLWVFELSCMECFQAVCWYSPLIFKFLCTSCPLWTPFTFSYPKGYSNIRNYKMFLANNLQLLFQDLFSDFFRWTHFIPHHQLSAYMYLFFIAVLHVLISVLIRVLYYPFCVLLPLFLPFFLFCGFLGF